MTKLNLSEKLYVDNNGKRFAYADDIHKAVRELKELPCMDNEQIEEIDKAFGDELK